MKPQRISSFNKNKIIAIVDDNDHNLKAIEMTLESEEFNNFHSFASGEEFLVYLEKGGKVDLVLMDSVMKGISGLETIKQMYEMNDKYNHVEVIIHTAYPEHINKIKSLKQGVCYYLEKPFDVNELILQIEIIFTRLDKIQA
ncbi:MAG: response regulator [Spirochaetia bacterium]|nr:response regulator [Spirochaetia bacterium]